MNKPYTVGTKQETTPPSKQKGKSSRRWWILGTLLLVLLIIPSLLAEMLTDWMWFGSQSLADVYTTRLWLALGVFFVATLLAALLCWVNWRIAWRIAQPSATFPGQQEFLPKGLVRGLILAAALIVGILMGFAAADEWSTILLFINGVPFGQTDPLFNNDIGFYVFGLPFYRFLRGWTLGLLILAAIGSAIIYLLGLLPSINRQLEQAQRRGSPTPITRPSFTLDHRIGTHGSILGAILLLLLAVGYWLDRFGLLYSSRAVAYGAGYTDVSARLPAFNIMMAVAGITALLLLVNIRVRTWRLLLGAIGIWLVALVLVAGVYPFIIQSFVVQPNQLSLEKPYIENNISATRKAFGLDKFKEREVPAVESVTQAQVNASQNTVQNIRLWDYRPLLDTYAQLQEIRSYYSFGQVDIDRYMINGRERQVMLSAREIAPNELNPQVRNWQNQRLVYTHGYGAVVSPVNEIQGEGLPNLLVKDIPPVTNIPELKITRPEIYYGEQPEQYVFVNSKQQEFDYPLGDKNQNANYKGQGGVEMSNYFTKLLFALRFGDGNVMLTDYITPQTRAMFHRNIHDMVRLLAPFLNYDADPYLVISDGKLYWVQDAYTYTDLYPYSTPHPEGFNYIRNSVKVVIDAYNGTAVYYVTDSSDPIVQAYRGIFPALFRDQSQMPAGIRAHLRYPEQLMNYQAEMYATFHMTDPQVFFQKEDVWNVPRGSQSEGSVPLEAYYVNMQLPGETKEGFMLILPFTPATKDNMIAWMAAKSDGAEYGQVDVIRYPKQQVVLGPKQVDARINQDPTISQQLTLWNQSGSAVIRGNLLTIPISNSVLYVQPLFLQATASRFPELKRVIVATGNSVGIGSDLKSALDVAFKITPAEVIAGDGGTIRPGTTPTTRPNQTPSPGGIPRTGNASDLTQSALRHYDLAQTALKKGDLATYQREIDAMKADLDALASIVGVPTPVPPSQVPVGTPVP